MTLFILIWVLCGIVGAILDFKRQSLSDEEKLFVKSNQIILYITYFCFICILGPLVLFNHLRK
jgi:hypothetical protein